MRLLRLVTVLLMVTAALAGPVHAQEPADACRVVSGEAEEERQVCAERVYYECVGDIKAQNVAILQGQVPGWSTTEPTQSFTTGAGCGTAETALTNASNPANGHDGVWQGTFTGNLDSMTLEFHKIDTTSRTDDVESLLLWIQVDGVDRVARTTDTTIEVAGTRSSTGLTISYVVSLTDLKLVTEVGTGETERSIMISARSFANYPGAWVWGAAEVPSGITFNPETLAPHRIRAS